MKTLLKLAGLAAIAIVIALPARAAAPLVDAAWLKGNLGKDGVVVLDVTGKPAAQPHIPGAVLTHYKKDNWRVDGKSNGKKVSGLLPPVDHLEALIGGLGIGNGDHVVIVANGAGATEMGVATRLYWTFKVLGHDEVSILNGGMAAWLGDKGNPLDKATAKPAAKTFKADFQPALLATTADVRKAVGSGDVALIDSRTAEQHLGINKSGAVAAYGTIPGAISVPAIYTTENGGGKFREKNAMQRLYGVSEAPVEGKTITFCNTGHWASIGWFVNSEILGNKSTAMYDGSMAEWTTDDKAPVERKVNLD